MSNNKSAQKRAQKRNARAKQKSTSNAKARNTPTAVAARERRRVAGKLGGFNLDFDTVLSNAVRQVNNGTKELETDIKTPEDMINGIKRNIGEVFKLFSYVVLLNGMIEKKIIDYTLSIDLKAVALDLIDIDSRVSRLLVLLKANEEEALVTECLDIGTAIQNHSSDLYIEVTRSEPHALVIEETLSSLRETITEDVTEGEKTAMVLKALSYDYLAKVSIGTELEQKPESATSEEVAPTAAV